MMQRKNKAASGMEISDAIALGIRDRSDRIVSGATKCLCVTCSLCSNAARHIHDVGENNKK